MAKEPAWKGKKKKSFFRRPVSKEDAMKAALCAEIMKEIRTKGKLRDEIRRVLEDLPPWTPFEDVTDILSSPLARTMGIKDPAVLLKAQELLGVGNGTTRMYQNSRYIVKVTQVQEGGWHLSIRTLQNDARHDWREYQLIKNELCGPDCEAVELYPAESRLVDTANQFFVHVLPPGMRVPLGFEERLVMRPGDGGDGTNQRPWEPGQEPPDAREAPAAGVMGLIYERAMKALQQGDGDGEDPESEGDCDEAAPQAADGDRPAGRDPGGSDRVGQQPGERGEGRQGDGAGGEDHEEVRGAVGKGHGEVRGHAEGEGQAGEEREAGEHEEGPQGSD